jgi:hypothetical protein
MTSKAVNGGRGRASLARMFGWGFAALLMLLPLAAMQFTSEVNWTGSDFLFAGLLIGGVGLALELAVRKSDNLAYRAGMGLALAASFLLIWINSAVGIIGDEGNAANLLYAGVLAVALFGALGVRFRPGGMAVAMAATALAHAGVGLFALLKGLGAAEPPGALGILVLNGGFTCMWLLSAAFFRKAAREPEKS